MPAYEDRWIAIHGGDMRDVLPTLHADSIHAVITSPPYWNLRDYGLSPSIWGGDPAHEHVFGTEIIAGGPAGQQGATSQRVGRSNVKEQSARGRVLGAFCECGAWQGQLGLEPTPEIYVEHLVLALREVRRVLRPDGTLWLNLGDSYISTGGERTYGSYDGAVGRGPATSRMGALASSTGLKPKDLAMVPARAAIALQADGWWLRKDIIWAKNNPMPESIEDRPTSSHEHVFLLAKSERYYYDGDAIRETAVYAEEARYDPGTDGLGGDDRRTGRSTRRFGKREAADPLGLERRPSGWAPPEGHNTMSGRYKKPTGWNDGPTEDDRIGRYPRKQDAKQQLNGDRLTGFNDRWADSLHPLGRNKRDVWTIATAPYPGAHFATFPPKLVEPMILASTSEHGVCPKCGGPWARIVTVTTVPRDMDRPQAQRAVELAEAAGLTDAHLRAIRSTGSTDAGKAQVTQTGYGNNTNEVMALAAEAKEALGGYFREFLLTAVQTSGWRPTCGDYPRTTEWREIPGQKATESDAHYQARVAPRVALQADLLALWAPLDDAVPATVLDPFGGAGTVALVAQQQRRKAVLVDLNPEYLKQAIERTSREWGHGGQRPRDEGKASKALDLGNGHRVEPLWSTPWEEVMAAYAGEESEDGHGHENGRDPVADTERAATAD